VAGAVILAPLALRIGRGRALAWSLALLPLALAGYGSARSLWLAVPALFVVGLVYMGVLAGLQTAVQLHAPAAYRGRVLSFFLVALGVAYPIGALVQGPVADHIGVGWTTVAAALILAATYLLTVWRWPAFVRAVTADPADDQEAATLEPAGEAQPAGESAGAG
jgi:predicted MFS family arabinose efflux permease